jgi:hypothetical protein
VDKTKRGQATELMAVADRAGLPGAAHLARASPHEVTRVEPPLAACVLVARPEQLIGDQADESDPLDARLAAQGIALIAPHRTTRQTPTSQGGRPWRFYRRRWTVERLLAWLQHFRHVLVRHDIMLRTTLGVSS